MPMSVRPTPGARRLAALAAGAALVLVAACGDDGDDGDDASTTSDPPANSDADVDLARYCEDEATLDQLFQVGPEDPDAFQAALLEAGPVIERVLAGSPDAVTDEMAVLADAYEQVVAEGDPSPFFSDEVAAADAAIHAHDLEACGWEVVDVGAEDFAFEADFPTEPGTVSFELENTGAEPHALVVARKHDDVDGAALEVFNALEDHEALLESFDITASVFAAPDSADYGIGELTPGEYVAFCPIPVGTTADAEGDGPPHFAVGMATDFEVSR